MPKRNDVQKVMIIGSGPIVIGQACEFDYSGTQACKALRKLGYEIVLVNSNPATIMTDPGMADATYIEPLNVKAMEEIIAKERPDALLPNLGGQSGLNLSSELHRKGVLEKYGVKVIGVDVDAIERGEDRIAFKETMNRLGIDMPKSKPAFSVEEAEKVAAELGYPVVVRPAYTLGGTGGGHVYNVEELRTVAGRGLSASLVNQILIEESVLGWEELELEVVRDAKNQMITVCFIENVDAMGVHTGDSFCVAPMLTIDPELQKRLQKYSYDIVEAIQVIGGTNIQFAHDPQTGRVVVIEINPRTSRSSALASKATGFPIALISSMLAGGLTLDEIPYWREGTLDKYTPWGDYVVVKFARWAFEKFPGSEDRLGTQMRAVGEVMSIGKTYKEALQKSIRSLETGRYGLGFAKDFNRKSLGGLMELLAEPTSERQFIMYEALRKGARVEDLYKKTHIKPWFIEQMKELVELEEKILTFKGKGLPDDLFRQAKKDGFSDRYLSKLLNVPEKEIRERRLSLKMVQAWDAVPVSGVENAAYYYSTYNGPDRVKTSSRNKIMVLGGGPNRIGQGIEFDYCCVHAAFTLRDEGYESIMINCNPETVSTDFDTSDKLYFEPLTVEDVLSIYEKEKPQGVIVQFGGQTPLNLAAELAAAGVKILGTSPEAIDLAEDRDRFRHVMRTLGIPQPESGMASKLEEALQIAETIGYPLMVRPSYVLGGRAMEVVHDEEMLKRYVAAAVDVTPERPILIDKFLDNAIEAEADAIADGGDAFVPSVMEHIELAGIHSGDSACVLPPVSLWDDMIDRIERAAYGIVIEMGAVGLVNIQMAVKGNELYIIEANPRASRTVPYVSKAVGIPVAKLAAKTLIGKKLSELLRPYWPYPSRRISESANQPSLDDILAKTHMAPTPWPAHSSVKEVVLPFRRFPGTDARLGPEMRSTGEVMSFGASFPESFAKAQISAGNPLPTQGAVLVTLADPDKRQGVPLVAQLSDMGFDIVATRGTARVFKAMGIPVQEVAKVGEGRPDCVDLIAQGHIDLVVNTPSSTQAERVVASQPVPTAAQERGLPLPLAGKRSVGYQIRTATIDHHVPYVTSLVALRAAVAAIKSLRSGKLPVRALQEIV
jgi:carbamoyl-phosphate synthase large subunit